MSGPKVVNIDSIRHRQRRECNALLRELSVAVEECLLLQDSEAPATHEFQKVTGTLLARLNKLRAAEQWSELHTTTSAQRDFYRSEADGLRQRCAERRTSALRREHRLRQGAAQLVTELSSLPSSSARDAALQKLSTADDIVTLQGAVAHAENVVAAHRSSKADAGTDHLRGLAAAYADPLAATASSPRQLEADRDPDEVRLERCWSLLGELDTLSDTAVDAWKQKASRAAAAEAKDRSLLLDSLALELTSHLRARRARQAAIAAVQTVLADLANVTAVEGQTWHMKLSAALSPQVSAEEALGLAASARLWLDQEISSEDAREQRTAVLRALTALGYEVREGMAAAWTEQGRVVVHKPDDSVYGLELSAPATGPAFQVRVVAAGSLGRSKQRDYEVEQTWCGEFTRLQSILVADGFPTKLTQAHEPGTIPLKTVSGKDPNVDGRRILKNRTLSRPDAE